MRKLEEIEKEMRAVSAKIAVIVDYVNGSISERPRKYRKADGTESGQKALPTLQYYAAGRQKGQRVPRKMLPAMQRLVENGRRRKALLRRLDELAAERAVAMLKEGVQKKTSRRSRAASWRCSGGCSSPRCPRPTSSRTRTGTSCAPSPSSAGACANGG